MPKSVFAVVLQSFGILRKNPGILIPVFLVYLAITIIGILAVIITGIYPAGSIPAILGFHISTYFYHVLLLHVSSTSIVPFLALITLASIVLGLVQLLLGGMYVSIGEQFYKKSKISIRAAFARAKTKYLDMLGAGILLLGMSLLAGLILGAILYLGIKSLETSFSWGAYLTVIIFGIIAAITAIVLAVVFFQTTVIIIVENKGPVPSIMRSIEIGKKNFFSILALYIAVAIIYLILSLFALIPVLGIIIQFLGSASLGVIAILLQPGFYFNYVSKKKQ